MQVEYAVFLSNLRTHFNITISQQKIQLFYINFRTYDDENLNRTHLWPC